MKSVLKVTAAQKRYGVACDACRAWAKSASAEVLSAANSDSLARSYGIEAKDASNIILKARRERNI